MENASRALIMAGAVLLALIIIGALVFFFNNLSNLQATKQSSEEIIQAAEFNKQYDVYARNVYGSELLSIANKIHDYNIREAETNGYTKIELYVTFSNDLDKTFFKKGTYTSSTIKTEIKKLEDKIDEIGNKTIKSEGQPNISRKVSKLASMRTKDIEELGFNITQYRTLVDEYNTYKTLLTEIKAKVFKYIEMSYDKYNGRVTQMKYEI